VRAYGNIRHEVGLGNDGADGKTEGRGGRRSSDKEEGEGAPRELHLQGKNGFKYRGDALCVFA